MIPASRWILIHGPADGTADPAAGGPVVARFHGDTVRRLLAFADYAADNPERSADALLFGDLAQRNGTLISVESIESIAAGSFDDCSEAALAPFEGMGLLGLTLATGCSMHTHPVGCVRSKAGSRLVADEEDRRMYRTFFGGGPGLLVLVRCQSATMLEAACYFGDAGELPLSVSAQFLLFCQENPLPAVFLEIGD